MIDRRKIAELRLMLVINESPAGSEQTLSDLETAVYPHLGELLALADAALEIRAAASGGALAHISTLGEATRVAMMKLDDLEREAERVKGTSEER